MNKITVVCHKDHDKGYDDYIGKCLLCEVERLQKREWQGLTDEEMHECWGDPLTPLGMKHARMIEAKLKEKNHG